MCLTTKRILPNVAMKDIEVYKVYMMKYDESELVSPYQYMHYKNDVKEITASSKRVLSERRMGHLIEREVSEGYIHAWQYKTNAYLSAISLSLGFAHFVPVVWKCVIPKGTLYFKGEKDICAKKLKVVEKLDSVADMKKKMTNSLTMEQTFLNQIARKRGMAPDEYMQYLKDKGYALEAPESESKDGDKKLEPLAQRLKAKLESMTQEEREAKWDIQQ